MATLGDRDPINWRLRPLRFAIGTIVYWMACLNLAVLFAAEPRPSLIANGDFETADRAPAVGTASRPADWYLLRQATWVASRDVDQAGHYLRFENSVPGRAAQAQQHFPLDGRRIRACDASVRVRARSVAPGQSGSELPAVRISFLDSQRQPIGEELLGPWSGTFDWRAERTRFDVPARCRVALVFVGLWGATGEVAFDDLRLVPAEVNPSALPRREER